MLQTKTFLARLVKHAIADTLAARKAACRDYRREKAVLSQQILVTDNEHPFYKEWVSSTGSFPAFA